MNKDSDEIKPLILSDDVILKKIHKIRGIQVMIDRDLAGLYGINVKTLNQAIKRNIERFPDNFMFQLNEEEFNSLRSQFVTLEDTTFLMLNNTLNVGRGKHRKYLPYVFTEQGSKAAKNFEKKE
ncbi:MAG: ORF6N domain-containing protein [Nanoarchaeota archaeon]